MNTQLGPTPLGPTPLGPTPEQILSMRTAIMERVAPAPALQPEKPQRARRIGFVAVGVGALAAALVVTSVIMPIDDHTGASAQAVETLDSAARAIMATSDPALAPGQYLRIATVQASGVGDGSVDAPMWQHMASDELYIPADRSDVWVLDRHILPVTVYFSEAGRLGAERANADPDRLSPDIYRLYRAEAGAFYGSPRTTPDFAAFSRDPETLRDQFYDEYIGGSASIDEDVWVRITELLQLHPGEVPADLRAAFYRTLALIPGVTVFEEAATLDGRTGVALGHTEPARGSLMRDEIIIDPTTGQLIGTRGVWLTNHGGLPAGTVYSWSSVQASIVDTAP